MRFVITLTAVIALASTTAYSTDLTSNYVDLTHEAYAHAKGMHELHAQQAEKALSWNPLNHGLIVDHLQKQKETKHEAYRTSWTNQGIIESVYRTGRSTPPHPMHEPMRLAYNAAQEAPQYKLSKTSGEHMLADERRWSTDMAKQHGGKMTQYPKSTPESRAAAASSAKQRKT